MLYRCCENSSSRSDHTYALLLAVLLLGSVNTRSARGNDGERSLSRLFVRRHARSGFTRTNIYYSLGKPSGERCTYISLRARHAEFHERLWPLAFILPEPSCFLPRSLTQTHYSRLFVTLRWWRAIVTLVDHPCWSANPDLVFLGSTRCGSFL